jgi:hypothetical protein
MARFGNVTIKIRPLRLALLVDPENLEQTRDAIRLASSLWGGAYFPIIALYKRMPKTWREGPIKAPHARDVVLGYIDAFDPDILVQFSRDVPQYVRDREIKTIRPDEVWRILEENRGLSPNFGIGLPDILTDVFEQFFKYKAKYPVRVFMPVLPKKHTLFWASVFGELPQKLLPHIKRGYYEALEIEDLEVKPEEILHLLKGNNVFPRRLTQHGLEHHPRSHGMPRYSL